MREYVDSNGVVMEPGMKAVSPAHHKSMILVGLASGFPTYYIIGIVNDNIFIPLTFPEVWTVIDY